MAVMPAAAAASTASGPNPLVTATIRTERRGATASIRSLMAAARRATRAASTGGRIPGSASISVGRDQSMTNASRPAHDDARLALALTAGSVAEPLVGARRARAGVAHERRASTIEGRRDGGGQVERRSPIRRARPHRRAEGDGEAVEVRRAELVAAGSDARPEG